MKANGIACTDYRAQGDTLRIWLRGAKMEEILDMERGAVHITTDTGEEAETFFGFANLKSVTWEAESGLYRAELSRTAGEGVGAALDALAEENAALRKSLADAGEETQKARADIDFLAVMTGVEL